MSPRDYVQLFLLGLLFTGVLSTCTDPRPLPNVDLEKVPGAWYIAKVHGKRDLGMDETVCTIVNIQRANETHIDLALTLPNQTLHMWVHVNTDTTGTWEPVDGNYNIQVIYLSADGTKMMIASCIPSINQVVSILFSKHIPISREELDEIHHAVEVSRIPAHDHFTWEVTTTCPPA